MLGSKGVPSLPGFLCEKKLEKGSFRTAKTLEAWLTLATKPTDNNSKLIPNQ